MLGGGVITESHAEAWDHVGLTAGFNEWRKMVALSRFVALFASLTWNAPLLQTTLRWCMTAGGYSSSWTDSGSRTQPTIVALWSAGPTVSSLGKRGPAPPANTSKGSSTRSRYGRAHSAIVRLLRRAPAALWCPRPRRRPQSRAATWTPGTRSTPTRADSRSGP